METLKAKIDRYLYRNNDNSYSIAKVTTKDKLEEIVVGYLPVLMEDTFYEFTGEWVNHNQYGKQFKIESFTKSSEQTEEGPKVFSIGMSPRGSLKIASDVLRK